MFDLAVPYLILINLFIVAVAALAAGLTISLMSISKMDLQLLEASGAAGKAKAQKLRTILADPHFLLVVLLCTNATAQEALPLFLDALVPDWLAIVLAVTCVLILGEIVPQSLFLKHRFIVGPKLVPLVKFLMCAFCCSCSTSFTALL